MRRLIAFLLICSIFFSCTTKTVKSLHDYDEVTYEKKSNVGNVKLGTIKVTALDFIWEEYNSKDKIVIKLMDRLEKKAIKKYGNNIDIIDVKIGKTNTPSSAALWIAGGTLFYSAGIGGALVSDYNQVAYNILMGTSLASLLVFLFKGIEASATIIKDDTEYIPNTYKLVTDNQITRGRNLFFSNRERLEKEKELQRIQEDIGDKSIQIMKNNTRMEFLQNELRVRGKELNSPVTIMNKGIKEINSADGVSCFISFKNITDKMAKYVKFDLVPYNRVFDQAYSTIDGKSKKTVTVTDFISPNDEYHAYCENVWYNSTIISMKVDKIEMIFIDETSLVIEGNEKIENIEFTWDEYREYGELESENKVIRESIELLNNELRVINEDLNL